MAKERFRKPCSSVQRSTPKQNFRRWLHAALVALYKPCHSQRWKLQLGAHTRPDQAVGSKTPCLAGSWSPRAQGSPGLPPRERFKAGQIVICANSAVHVIPQQKMYLSTLILDRTHGHGECPAVPGSSTPARRCWTGSCLKSAACSLLPAPPSRAIGPPKRTALQNLQQSSSPGLRAIEHLGSQYS